MIWWLVLIGAAVMWIGGVLTNDGDSGLVKWVGLFVTAFGGVLFTIGWDLVAVTW